MLWPFVRKRVIDDRSQSHRSSLLYGLVFQSLGSQTKRDWLVSFACSVWMLVCIPIVFASTDFLTDATPRGPIRHVYAHDLLILPLLLLHVAPFIALTIIRSERNEGKMQYVPAKARLLRRQICPVCGYSLAELKPDPDGHTTCPECGTAWKLK